MMETKTILYMSDPDKQSDSVLAELKRTGYEVVNTDNPREGLALLYIMRTVAVVLLNNRANEQAGFDVAQSLRQIRPGVPIMRMCPDPIDTSPSWTDRCVSRDDLTSTLQHVLTTELVA
jgi:DNA-binding NtrC family response regulator